MHQVSVYFSLIVHRPQRTLYQVSPEYDFGKAIQEVINPDESVSRYDRLWRFSKPKILDAYLAGKLGYLSAGTERKSDYDEGKRIS